MRETATEYKLTSGEMFALTEALRRHLRFHDHATGGTSITKHWTGLGSATQYKAAVSAGLMECATELNPRYTTWWRLTEKGARIVAYWLGQGWTAERIEQGAIPSSQVPIFLG
jgi:hypothetical protein